MRAWSRARAITVECPAGGYGDAMGINRLLIGAGRRKMAKKA